MYKTRMLPLKIWQNTPNKTNMSLQILTFSEGCNIEDGLFQKCQRKVGLAAREQSRICVSMSPKPDHPVHPNPVPLTATQCHGGVMV